MGICLILSFRFVTNAYGLFKICGGTVLMSLASQRERTNLGVLVLLLSQFVVVRIFRCLYFAN